MSTKVEFKYSELFKQAVIDAFKKLHPRDEIKNLVMFVVWLGSIWTTIILFLPGQFNLFNVQICFWLWFTCLFANFAEAMAECRGKAHADALRKMRTKTMARALNIVLISLTPLFIVVVFVLPPYAHYNETAAGQKGVVLTTIPVLLSLIVCLIPTTIGGLLSAIGIAGIDRLMRRNVLATSGRAVEAAGDVDVLLLDKTGTITLGNRMATEFIPAPGVTVEEVANAAQLASLADETPEGRSIVVLAKEKYNLRGREVAEPQAKFVAFTAQTRMSGLDLIDPDGKGVRVVRKGAAEAVRVH